jgi:predicted dehydrogenase
MQKKIAIVGAGLIGKRHIEAASYVDNISISAIVDTSCDASTYADENSIPLFPSIDALFKSQNPDGIILCTPTNLHVVQGLECISHNCPVLIEKPIAVEATKAEGLVQFAKERSVPILVGHHRRHNPIIQCAKQAIEDGQLGEIRSVNAMCWFYKPDEYFEIAPWRKALGAGPISVNLVHDIDLIRYLCGEVKSVVAVSTPAKRGFENEDLAAAILRFENGVIGTISVSDSAVSPWSWEMTSGEYPVYPKTDQFCYQISGSKGALSIPDLKLWQHENEPDWWSPISATMQPYKSADPLIMQLSHFAEVIEGNEIPLVSGEEGLKTLQVIEAIQTSAAKGVEVNIEELYASEPQVSGIFA